MAKALWNGTVIAESTNYEVVEGNIYFPPSAVKKEFLKETHTHSTCPWKGRASYYTVVVNGQENKNAAWYYPNPNSAAAQIKNYVAFWRGVKVEK